MIRANALFIVVVIALIIGILCSSLIVISYYQRLQVQKDLLIKRLDLNAYSAINILLSGSDNATYGEQNVEDLFGEENDSVSIKKSSWGIFEIGTVKSFASNHQKIKSILYGYQLDELTSSSIYLTDQNSPLALAGSTFISGKCYLPEAGVKRAYIEGQTFSRKNLINGEVKKSNFALPSLDKNIIDRLSAIFKINGYLGDDFELYSADGKDTISRSFNEKTLIISNSNISLRGKNYQGNIIIYADNLIEIDSSSKLSDILIFARAVNVSDYFTGNLQIFSTDSINVGDHCKFLYPSALGLLKKDFNVLQPFIKIMESCKFKGIIFTQSLVHNQEQTLVSLGKNTEIEGQIYADGFVDLKGSVFGNVSCNKFVLRTPSSVYENHLLNCTIDNSKLSPYFVGSSIVSSSKKKQIIKWLE